MSLMLTGVVLGLFLNLVMLSNQLMRNMMHAFSSLLMTKKIVGAKEKCHLVVIVPMLYWVKNILMNVFYSAQLVRLATRLVLVWFLMKEHAVYGGRLVFVNTKQLM